ncbi:hypothetical protein VQ045_21815, partial [Aurantimonas sp. E1-2-R+4]
MIEAIEAGLSTRAAARRFAIGFSTSGSWHRDWCRKGTFEPDRQGQPEGSKLDAHEAFILALIDTDEKDISLAEIAERLEADKGVSACHTNGSEGRLFGDSQADRILNHCDKRRFVMAAPVPLHTD